MTSQGFQAVLDRYLEGTASESEQKLVENFYARLQAQEEGRYAFQNEEKETMKHEIYDRIQKSKGVKKRISPISPGKSFWKVAAAILIIFGIGLTYNLAEQPEVKYLTKSTGKGQKATVRLSDGSMVRLNAESAIRYPERFSTTTRIVKLKGEAFFDVKKEKARPFIVTSHGIQTTVLGTSFNIHAYDSLAVSVALVTGKVKVNALAEGSSGSDSEVFLAPGDRALYDGVPGEMEVKPFDIMELTAWKDGIIYLSKADYDQVFDRLSLWYGVSFQFINSPSENWEYSGEFKDMSLELVLSTISYSKEFEFKIQNETVTVKFKN